MLKRLLGLINNLSSGSAIHDETFIIDFVNERFNEDDAMKKTEVIVLAGEEDYIIIGGKKLYFDAFFIRNEGLSSDKKYFRIATPEYKFWVNPKDLNRFMTIMEHRHKFYMKRKEEKRANKIKAIFTPFRYDDIDNNIYHCFISDTHMIENRDRFNKAVEAIDRECKKNNGKLYKTAAKSAKYAIIFDYRYRIFSNVEHLHAKGFKVTSFELALKYFGLEHMWDSKKHMQQEREYMEMLKKDSSG